MMGVLLSSFYIYGKAVKYSAPVKLKAFSILWCLILAFSYAAKPFGMPLLMIRPIICVTSICFIWALTKIKIDAVISAYLVSFGISYILYYIAVSLVSLIAMPLATEYMADSPADSDKLFYLLIYILVFAFHLHLSYLFFRIRRFQNGFPFIFKKFAVIVALISAGAILIFVTGVQVFFETNDTSAISMFFVGTLIIGSGIIIWIRRGIKNAYKQWTKENDDELHEQELAAKDREIQRYKDMYETVRVANHSTIHRQTALECRVAGILEKAQGFGLPSEINDELSVALADVRSLSSEYQDKVDQVKAKKNLPSTNVQSIDNLFSLFAERFAASKIDFNLKVNGSIPHMIENTVKQRKLETMIGDHLQDTLIAVNASDGAVRSVLVMIGESKGCYEFSARDSGIPFEVDTLVRLGTERVTTHADTGGSGIGFMTTFETMRECGASLIIHENAPGSSYTKTVTIRFDGKNQYTIKTWRPESFPSQSDKFILISNGDGL